MTDSILNSFDIWTAVQGIKSKGRVKSIDNINLEGIAKLRELILELAVHGKLVWQDPTDEPAIPLLKRIRKQKERLKKEGKFKKTAPLPEINEDQKPFKVPNTWEWIRLGNLTNKIGSGSTPRGSDYSNSGIIFLRSQNIRNEGLLFDDVVYISEGTNTKMSNTIVLPYDILLNITGGSLGRSTIFPADFKIANVSQHVTIIRPTEGATTSYLHLCISSPYIQNLIWGRQVGAAREGLSKKILELFEIPLPPLAEQHRIVAKVDELMALCDKLEDVQTTNLKTHQVLVKTLLQTLTQAKDFDALHEAWQRIAPHFDTLFCTEDSIGQLKQTILQLAIMGRLVKQSPTDEPATALLKRIKAEKEKLVKSGKLKKEKELPPITADEITFELPEGWVWCRLGEITSLITKGSSPKWQGVDYVEEGLLFVTSENVDSYNIDLSKRKFVEWKFNEIEPRSILKKGDFLMNIVGGSIGRTAIYDLDEIANINQAVCLIRTDTEILNSEYLLHFFNSEICIGYMFDKQVDNARPNLSMGNIAKFVIPLPPLAEQQRIVAKVQQLQQQLSQLETRLQQSNAYAKQLLQTVLQQAFEGKAYKLEEEEELRMVAEG